LSALEIGEPDKLGNTVRAFLWLGANYAVYRTDEGVYVHFSNDSAQEVEQRSRFTEICPELCELRYLTAEMRGRDTWWRRALAVCSPSGTRHPSEGLYDHNIAQAIMLTMEAKVEPAKKIAEQALEMAVQRVTNDNTIRYVVACLVCLTAVIIFGLFLLQFRPSAYPNWESYVIAGIFGAAGAVFSIATRLQSFQLKPCHQSGMNYWMSATRVGMGVIAAIALLLLASTVFGEMMKKMFAMNDRILADVAAVLGLVGGFAERLVPNLLRQTIGKIESTVGTPVQAVRKRDAAASRSPPECTIVPRDT
jgi:hypothetical protein